MQLAPPPLLAACCLLLAACCLLLAACCLLLCSLPDICYFYAYIIIAMMLMTVTPLLAEYLTS